MFPQSLYAFARDYGHSCRKWQIRTKSNSPAVATSAATRRARTTALFPGYPSASASPGFGLGSDHGERPAVSSCRGDRRPWRRSQRAATTWADHLGHTRTTPRHFSRTRGYWYPMSTPMLAYLYPMQGLASGPVQGPHSHLI